MKAPQLPHAAAIDALLEGASNDTQFATAAAAAAPVAPSTGWDPYEVWRSRVFEMQPARYNKDRGNT